MTAIEEEFDFDDAEAYRPTLKPKPKKQELFDFFEADDQKPAIKLPTIAKAKPQDKSLKVVPEPHDMPAITRNPTHVSSRHLHDDDPDDYEPVDEFIVQEHATPHPSKAKLATKLHIAADHAQEKVAHPLTRSVPQSATAQNTLPNAASLSQKPEEYLGEAYQEDGPDDYNDSFEQEIQEQKHPAPKADKPSAQHKVADKQSAHQPGSHGATAKPTGGDAKSLASQKKLQSSKDPLKPQSASKKSLPSAEKGASRSAKPPKAAQSVIRPESRQSSISKTRTEKPPVAKDRHLAMVDKLFPEEDVQAYTPDKLNRMNDRVRTMIRKFNEELNELLERNMAFLRESKPEKEPSVEERVRLLAEQAKSGEVALECMERELDRLKGREGELKEEEFELIVDRQIEECTAAIGKMQKALARLRHEVNTGGDKLTKQNVQAKLAQQLHNVRTLLLQAKKDDEKNEAHIRKLEANRAELEARMPAVEERMEGLLETAREKGMALSYSLGSKLEELRSRVHVVDQHRQKIEGLTKAKSDLISHDNAQVASQLRVCEQENAKMNAAIDMLLKDSYDLMAKAKANTKLSARALEDIEKRERSLDRMKQSFLDSKAEHSQIPAYKPDQPVLRTSHQNNQPPAEPQVKPNFFKKKDESRKADSSQKVPQINSLSQRLTEPHADEDGISERVWKDQPSASASRLKQPEDIGGKEDQPKPKLQQDSHKKPFNFRRSRDPKVAAQPASSESRVQAPALAEAPPKQGVQADTAQLAVEDPPAAPRMMRFNRRQKQETSAEQSEDTKPPGPSIHAVSHPPEHDEEVAIGPRRMLQRKPLERREEYVPTVKKADESHEYSKDLHDSRPQEAVPLKSPPKLEKPTPLQANPGKIASSVTLNGSPQPSVQAPQPPGEEKPKITLRLRDRRKPPEESPYSEAAASDSRRDAPQSRLVDLVPTSSHQTGSEPAKLSSFNSPSQGTKTEVGSKPIQLAAEKSEEMPMARREGLMRKPKVHRIKEAVNIYEQAVEAAGEVSPRPKDAQVEVRVELGLDNTHAKVNLQAQGVPEASLKKKVDDFADLMADELSVGRKVPRAKAKNTDFLDDLL